MEIKYLRLIQTIAEEGNIVNSADKLFLTKSALSHQLREIEERLGFKVFIRARNSWKLTEEGMELYHLSKTVLAEIEGHMQKIQHIREGSKGLIRISTECYSFYSGLPGFIQKMALLYPGMEIQLVVEATHHPVTKILSNELDITITTTQPESKTLGAIELFEDEIYAVVHEENRLSEKAYIGIEDFWDIHLIIHSYPLETVSVYQNFLRVHKVEPKKITAIPLTEIALELVKANMGIMCIPKWALKAFKIPDHLMFKPIGQQGLKRKHYLVFREEDRHKKYLQNFIQNMEEEFMTY
ncbi:LysR family transcriptional regulator [Rapidithrix thailandica]|uniref:LysR family transcriptional regulator n=1 Tax=Rapidithrix thailandica TaxID=413964 RepID=A0AAW9S3J7_9BACT